MKKRTAPDQTYQAPVVFKLPEGVHPYEVYEAVEALIETVRPGGLHGVKFDRHLLNGPTP